MLEIAIPLMLGAGVVIGYLLGKHDQRGWLAEQYKIACWQRDQAMSQRDEAIDALAFQVGQLEQQFGQILNDQK